MFEDFDRETLLNGTWIGEYSYDHKVDAGQNFPITATFLTTGRKFHGTMIDGITDREVTYHSIVDAVRDRMTAEARVRARQILAQSPDLKFESSLPKESRIVGKISGSSVRFTKTYIGTHRVAWVDGSQRTPIQTVDNHQVDYRGVLSTKTATIEGRWAIHHRGIFRWLLPPDNSGGFRLFKKK